VPPLFRIIQEQSGTPWQEMYRVFNMGHRFEIYTSEKNAASILDIASGFNLGARVIGHCEASDTKRLTIETENGRFEY
jgi:phosphoribosylformylglycinamidine cyclo-ligase